MALRGESFIWRNIFCKKRSNYPRKGKKIVYGAVIWMKLCNFAEKEEKSLPVNPQKKRNMQLNVRNTYGLEVMSRLVVIMILIALASAAAAEQEDAPSLCEAVGDRFLQGVALSVKNINGEKSCSIAARHFNSIVAENCMKAEELHPAEDVYDFSDADRFVDFGERNGMKIIGHCLIWHSQCPQWFCHDGEGNLVGSDEMKRRMRDYIHTVVGRYKGRIHGWDVVNEAIEGDGSWRQSDFYKILGEEFIPLAFQYAHEADPEAELYYNDYSMDMEGKRERVVELIRELKRRGLRIDAVGMQTHADLSNPGLDEYEKSMLAYAGEGVNVMATEFDISILPFVTASANISDKHEYEDSLNPYTVGVPEKIQRQWDKRLGDFYALWTKHSDIVSRVTVWGLGDGDSWKNDFPVKGRTDYPLLFDRRMEMKPAVREVIKGLTAD